MNSISIVYDLYQYISLLKKIEESEQEYCSKVETSFPSSFNKSVSLEYNTITAKLNYKDKEETTYSDYFWAKFTIKEQNVSLADLSCVYPERENIIRDYLQQYRPATFPSQNCNTDILNKETEQYLNIADEIAKQAYLCSAGDDYYPGFFSKIIINDTGIILKQINHLNSRSINHKNNYYLRDLDFYIPNQISESNRSFNKEKIGKMIIYFSDRSSDNNKIGGDEIFKKIQEQKALFENETP